MNIFASLHIYAGKWSEKSARAFAPEEVSAVEKAEVVESNYGFSVCFFMTGGGQTYIPLDQNSSASIGTLIDLTKAQLVTLQRPGEQDIYRVRA